MIKVLVSLQCNQMAPARLNVRTLVRILDARELPKSLIALLRSVAHFYEE